MCVTFLECLRGQETPHQKRFQRVTLRHQKCGLICMNSHVTLSHLGNICLWNVIQWISSSWAYLSMSKEMCVCVCVCALIKLVHRKWKSYTKGWLTVLTANRITTCAWQNREYLYFSLLNNHKITSYFWKITVYGCWNCWKYPSIFKITAKFLCLDQP